MEAVLHVSLQGLGQPQRNNPQRHGFLMEGERQGFLTKFEHSEEHSSAKISCSQAREPGSHSHEDYAKAAHQDLPDSPTLLPLIKGCGKQKDLCKGSRIHAHILKCGCLQTDISIGTALLRMYGEWGALVKAQELFEELPTWDVALWNVLIGGYAHHELGDEAVNCYERMRDEGFLPNGVTFVYVLKACASIRAYKKGKEVHTEINKQGLLEKNAALGTSLVDMYAKCGALAEAQEVLDKLPARDVATWTALISGYAQHELGDEALDCFERMQDEGMLPNVVTFICILKACGSARAIEKGKVIHAEVLRQGLLESCIVLGTALVDMYAKCGEIAKAQAVFDELPARDAAAWNALITGYVQHGLGHEALSCFEWMQHEGLSPNRVTFLCILKACGSIGAARKGGEIHAEVSRQGLLNKSITLGTALVDMYAKCGMLAEAQKVFDELVARDETSWTALMAGYVEHGYGDEALSCYEQMRHEGLSPNVVTFVCILKACGSIGAVEKGKEIHTEVCRQGLLKDNAVLGTAVVDMYAKCGALTKAQEVLDKLQARDVTTWTALLGGYTQHELGDEALNCFQQMQDEGIAPNTVTFVCVLKACGSIGATEKGKSIHVEVGRQGLLGKNIMLGTALVDMYANCGILAKAQEVFDELPARDKALWNALISGYVHLGDIKRVFDTFSKMVGDHIEPNTVTFTALLTTCNHGGLVEEGQKYFEAMSTAYGVSPSSEHYTCVVDLFSRAGHLDQAMSMIEKVPPSDWILLWFALLSACGKWVNMELGSRIFEHAVQIDERYGAVYVCMSNLYATAGMQEEVDKV